MRILVVFYSHSGRTRQVAAEIARRCGADMEEVLDARPSAGACAALRSIWDSLTGAVPPIETPSRDPADYDLVILGTPAWAWRVASPMRSYVMGNVLRFRRVAFFCTQAGSGKGPVFSELRRLCHQTPVSTLFVTETSLAEPTQQEPFQNFTKRLMSA
ncbi:MAG: flavodoxin [Burkholderiaceae bacterium]|nr:flavodoxin [Burkholderiaceae bacterium]